MNDYSRRVPLLRWMALGAWTAWAATAGLAAQVESTSGEAPSPVVILDAFVVTGSHIPVTENAFDARTTPMLRLDRTEIEEKGYGTVTELLQELPVNNGGSVPLANNGTGFTRGAASISLRGLGPDSTLVLLNGRRLAPFPIGIEGTTGLVDLNSIPVAALQRIEVLTDGASATYGADAIAGVVNLVTRRNITGTELDLRYGTTTVSNSSEISASLASSLPVGRAEVSVGFNTYHRNPIFARERAYMETPPFLSSFSSPFNLQVTRAAAAEALGQNVSAPIPGVADSATLFIASTFNNRNTNDGTLPVSAYQFSPGNSSFYNYNETAGSLPEAKRSGGFLSVELPATRPGGITPYADLFYQRTETINELAPAATGPFSRPGVLAIVIPARTATPLAAAGARTAPAGAYNPFNPFNQDISGGSRGRLAELGNRIYRDTNDATNVTLGLRRDRLADGWSFDASATYSRLLNRQHNTLSSISKFNRIMNAADPIFNPSSPDYIGTSIPYNPFGYYRNAIANNELVAPFALLDLHNRNESEVTSLQTTWSNRSLFTLPGGEAGFAAGIEYRWEDLRQQPDAAGLTGDLVGGQTVNITNEDREVGSLFAELNLPLVAPEQRSALAHALTVTLSARYEKFVSQRDDVVVPKLALKWLPFDDSFVVRGSWGQGYRQPSMFELYGSGVTSTTAPIRNPFTNVNEREQSVSTASSRRLRAEDSENVSVGFVWTPAWLKTDRSAFTVSLDHWNIVRSGAVTVDHQDVVDRFHANEPLLAGEAVVLGAGNAISIVRGVFRNLGEEKARGFDIATSYFRTSEGLGRFDAGVNLAYLQSYRIQQFSSAPFFEYAGWETDALFNNVTGDPSPGVGNDAYLKWKGSVFGAWSKGPLSVRANGNYLDGFRDFTLAWSTSDRTNPAGFRNVASSMIWDFAVSYAFGDQARALLAGTQLTLGVNNAFNREPPFVSSWGNNQVGYAAFLYSPEGRFIYMSLKKRF